MNMTVLAIILSVAAVVEIFGFTSALLLMSARMKELRMEREQFNSDILQRVKIIMDAMQRRDDRSIEILRAIAGHHEKIITEYNTMMENYESLQQSYNYILESFRETCEHYRKLLEAWKNVEERYSDCYEQLDQMNKKLDFMAEHYWNPDDDCEVLASQFLDIPAKDCKYNYCGECQNEDCPALNMYCTAGDPKECKYSDMSGYSFDEDK